jgi:two-component system copper resistance phosphate regulon response regulator CusR
VARIIIAEDEPRIAAFVEKGLRAHGLPTAIAGDGFEALHLVRSGEFDLVVLDLGLPQMDGLTVLHRIREMDPLLPVLILSGRGDTRDLVNALEAGADDYLCKPFKFEELLARVRARVRAGRLVADNLCVSAGDLELDLRSREARVAGEPVTLTAKEFALAETFARHPGQVLSEQQLLSHVWGYDYDPGSNIVAVYVRSLRRKLGADLIRTVRGAGYRLEPLVLACP